MPFFFKLTDKLLDETQWMHDVEFAISDFIAGCEEQLGDGASVTILFFRFANEEIAHHPTIEREYVIHTHVNSEHFVYNDVELTFRETDIDSTGFVSQLNEEKHDFLNDRLNGYINGGNVDDVYIHITCSDSVINITENGLWGEGEQEYRIGNRFDTPDSQSRDDNLSDTSDDLYQYYTGGSYKAKYLKYKRKNEKIMARQQ